MVLQASVPEIPFCHIWSHPERLQQEGSVGYHHCVLLFSVRGTRGNGFKLEEGKLQLDVG